MVGRIWSVNAGVVLGVVGLGLFLWASSIDWQAVPDGGALAAEHEVAAERLPCTGGLIERLRQTNLLNAGENHDRLGLEGASPVRGGRGFLTHSPYEPPYRKFSPTVADLRYLVPLHSQSFE